MSGSAILMMIIGMIIIWGGLGVSIYMAMKRSKS